MRQNRPISISTCRFATAGDQGPRACRNSYSAIRGMQLERFMVRAGSIPDDHSGLAMRRAGLTPRAAMGKKPHGSIAKHAVLRTLPSAADHGPYGLAGDLRRSPAGPRRPAREGWQSVRGAGKPHPDARSLVCSGCCARSPASACWTRRSPAGSRSPRSERHCGPACRVRCGNLALMFGSERRGNPGVTCSTACRRAHRRRSTFTA